MYLPCFAPKRFEGESVTFICCGSVQYVLGKKVKYIAMSVVLTAS
jgi:hypothetical protein